MGWNQTHSFRVWYGIIFPVQFVPTGSLRRLEKEAAYRSLKTHTRLKSGKSLQLTDYYKTHFHTKRSVQGCVFNTTGKRHDKLLGMDSLKGKQGLTTEYLTPVWMLVHHHNMDALCNPSINRCKYSVTHLQYMSLSGNHTTTISVHESFSKASTPRCITWLRIRSEPRNK